jgi:hypothetical protein
MNALDAAPAYNPALMMPGTPIPKDMLTNVPFVITGSKKVFNRHALLFAQPSVSILATSMIPTARFQLF